MSQPANVPITLWRNADYVETWVAADSFDASGIAVGPVNLTGYSAAMQVRLYGLAGGAALIDLATVTTAIQGIRFVEPTAGQMEVRITDATLEALPVSGSPGGDARFEYDLILTDPTGVESVYAYGEFIVKPGVTR